MIPKKSAPHFHILSTKKDESSIYDSFVKDGLACEGDEVISRDSFLDVDQDLVKVQESNDNTLFGVSIGFTSLSKVPVQEKDQNSVKTCNYQTNKPQLQVSEDSSRNVSERKFEILEIYDLNDNQASIWNSGNKDSRLLLFNDGPTDAVILKTQELDKDHKERDATCFESGDNLNDHDTISIDVSVKSHERNHECHIPELQNNIGQEDVEPKVYIKTDSTREFKRFASPINSDRNVSSTFHTSRFNCDIIGSHDIEFANDLSCILPSEPRSPVNQISSNYSIIHTNRNFTKKAKREVQQFDILGNVLKTLCNSSEDPSINVSRKVSDTMADHSRIDDLKEKLDGVAQLLVESLSKLKNDVLATKNDVNTSNSPRSLSYLPSGVGTTHFNVRCDNCHIKDFRGKRYKCLECWNFDLCELCEANTNHSHPMIRIIGLDDQPTFTHLNRFYKIKKSMESRSDDELKERFLRSLTDNQYADSLYRHVMAANSRLRTEEFLLEMTNIFG